ncbi:hypothetical protein [Streptomyces sp. NPDC058614]
MLEATESQDLAPAVLAFARHGAVASRRDKLAVRYEATVQIAAIDDWL